MSHANEPPFRQPADRRPLRPMNPEDSRHEPLPSNPLSHALPGSPAEPLALALRRHAAGHPLALSPTRNRSHFQITHITTNQKTNSAMKTKLNTKHLKSIEPLEQRIAPALTSTVMPLGDPHSAPPAPPSMASTTATRPAPPSPMPGTSMAMASTTSSSARRVAASGSRKARPTSSSARKGARRSISRRPSSTARMALRSSDPKTARASAAASPRPVT